MANQLSCWKLSGYDTSKEEPWTLHFKTKLNIVMGFSKVSMFKLEFKFLRQQNPFYTVSEVTAEKM